MIFNVFRKKDRTQKGKKQAKETMRHAESEKKEIEKRRKQEMRKANKIEKERSEREQKFRILNELLEGPPFNSIKTTVVAYRIVTMDEAIGWEDSYPTNIIEIVMASGERHYLHNRIRASTKNAISDYQNKKYFHFIPISVSEAESALECVLPKFAPIKLNCIAGNTQNCPLDSTGRLALTVNPEQANPSGLVLNYGLAVAKLWLNQKGKLCSTLEISNKTYEICRKRFEQQAEVFSREIAALNGKQTELRDIQPSKMAREKDEQHVTDGDSDDGKGESKLVSSDIGEKTQVSDATPRPNQFDSTTTPPESKIVDIDQNQSNSNNDSQSDVEIKPTEEELLKSLRTLKQIEPLKFHWNKILSFRVVWIVLGNRRYSAIQLISKDGYYDDLIYHELPEGIADHIIDLKPHGEAVSFSKYYLPLNISLVEKALGKVMPELSESEVNAEKIGLFVSFQKQIVSPGVKEHLELFPSEKLLDMESELSDWFVEVQNMWNSSRTMQILRISLPEYNRVMTKYQEYEEVKGVLVHRAEQKRKAAEEEARAMQDAQIQRAGDEGEKRVKYVLDCMGSGTIQVESNTINKYGKRCIMLLSEEWAKIPQEFDHIIIRENGVFLIETKNLSGMIEIDKSGNWTQTKDLRGRDKTTIAIEAPSFQAYRHEKLIRSFLAPEIPVSSIICLANPRALVKGQENSNVPVMKWDLLAQFIEERPSEKKLSHEEMEALHEQIKEHYYECSDDDNCGKEQ